jgi:predicted nicotinamide N-methyase
MRSFVYNKKISTKCGKRLGIPFIRSQLSEIKVFSIFENILTDILKSINLLKQICIKESCYNIEQSGIGLLGISTVVWDCGLVLIDYLVHLVENKILSLTTCLELGSGTGIVGITCVLLGADKCFLTDKIITSCLQSNITILPVNIVKKAIVSKFDWALSEDNPELFNESWGTIVCSDVLYDSNLHNSLLDIIKRLSFKLMILCYKRRHDEAEILFFDELENTFAIELIDMKSFPLININEPDTEEVYILHIFPK